MIMMSGPIENIRNIGIVAHIDAGKTTTTERILFYTGLLHRMGEVDDGTTTTDFDPEEAKRGITIYSAAITCDWHGTTINIIDTPGHVDFTAEVERSLRVLDGAVVIFSAVEGVEAQSETVWRQADRYHVPRICFINKMDRVGASFERTFDAMSRRLGAHPIVLQIPMGVGSSPKPNVLNGLIDLVEMKALYFDPESKGASVESVEIPDEFRPQAQVWRKRLLDTIALLDEDIFQLYAETGDVSSVQIHKLVREATIQGQLHPTFCGAAKDYIGVQPLLDGIARYLPSPLDRPPVDGTTTKKRGTGKETRWPRSDEPFCGLIFKIQADRHGDLCFIRVYSGILKSGSRVVNARTGKKELISQIWRVQADAREKIEAEQVSAGDIVGVIGPKEAVTGDTLCNVHHPLLLEMISFPETVISMAAEPESSAERKKLADTLSRLSRQDPTFNAKVSEETGQTIISGMGELHLEVLRDRMEREFGLKVRIHKPRVSYRETIREAIESTGVFIRQVAGATQFAKIKLRMEPFFSEEPIVIENKMKPNALPDELVAVLKQAVSDEARGGGLIGYPLMNVKTTLLDAEYREGETTEAAIQAAATDAIRKGIAQAGSALLEPIMQLEVVTPDEFLGNVQADLNARRAVITRSELRGDLSVIEAEVALSKMFGYATQVRSLSQGRASYTMEPLKYDEAPPEVLEAMMV